MSPENSYEFNNLVEMLLNRASNYPKEVGFIFLSDGETQEEKMTYEQLDIRAKSIAAQLQRTLGKGHQGQRVLLLYPPGLEMIAACFGCLYAGVIPIPEYPPDTTRLRRSLVRLKNVAKNADISLIMTSNSISFPLKWISLMFPLLWLKRWLVTEKIPLSLAKDWKCPDIKKDTLALLHYTSGSTSTPRGVMLSHGNLLSNLAMIEDVFGDIPPNSSGVSWLPMYHNMGLVSGVFLPVYLHKGVAILMSPILFLQKPLRWLQIISRYRCIVSAAPNFAYELCCRKITPQEIANLDLSCWKIAVMGAETIMGKTIKKFSEMFGECGFSETAFFPCYGLTEASMLVTGTKKKSLPTVKKYKLEQNQSSVAETGKEIVGCGGIIAKEIVRIVDPQTRIECSHGTIGEIWVQGPNITQGYWNNPEETQETFHACLATGEGPFLRTGDLGFFDEEELFITGRKKDLIIIHGKNIYPQDIENALYENLPQLQPAACAAFSFPLDGEEKVVVVAEIPRNYNRSTKEILDIAVRIIHRDFQIHLHEVVLIAQGTIFRTPSGKIQRYVCLDHYLSDSLKIVARSRKIGKEASKKQKNSDDHSLAAMEKWLIDAIVQECNIPSSSLSTDAHWLDVEMNSIQFVALAAKISSSIGKEESVLLFQKYPTIGSLAKYLSQFPLKANPCLEEWNSPHNPEESLSSFAPSVKLTFRDIHIPNLLVVNFVENKK
ncbi:MAG: AMP-binding protein [Candidatus Brocadiae bacterium]|nr:AMP-binding protein [Candidatus Brocadiia bacterium]